MPEGLEYAVLCTLSFKCISRVFCNVISGFICVYVILNSLMSNNDWAVFSLL